VQKLVIMLIIKHHARKTYWGKLGTAPHTQTFAVWTLEGSDGQLQATADFPPYESCPHASYTCQCPFDYEVMWAH